jgi:hypothetical protein
MRVLAGVQNVLLSCRILSRNVKSIDTLPLSLYQGFFWRVACRILCRVTAKGQFSEKSMSNVRWEILEGASVQPTVPAIKAEHCSGHLTFALLVNVSALHSQANPRVKIEMAGSDEFGVR